ncbi:MAG TPA: PKD-like domain-containing protein, partial [Segetibacter sp.]
MKNLKFYTLVYVVFLCVTFFNSSQVVAQCNVKLPKDFIECNNSAVSIQSNTDYAPIYSSDDPSDKYFWTITGGPFTYFGGTNRVDRYPKVNLQDGYIYQIVVRFTNSSGVCSDTQIVYRNVGLTAEINNPVQPDTTVCQSSQTFSLVASVEGPYTSFSWSSTGTGTFTNSNTFSPTYTLSQADKDNGRVQIIFNALANVNGSCFPNDTDTLTINILKLLGKDSSASVCSNNKLNYQPVVNGANQFTWTSQVVSGNVGGNSVSGTGKITDSLINNSTSTDAVVRYTITPIYQQCSGAPFSYLVTIKPKPSIIASNTLNLCTGSASNIQLASSVSNTLYTWTSTVITGSVSGNSNSNTPVSITSINDVLVNNSPSNTASVKYTITPYHPFGCIGQSVDALIALAPQVTQADAGPSRIICLKDTIHLNGNSPTSGSGTWSQLSGPTATVVANITLSNTSV